MIKSHGAIEPAIIGLSGGRRANHLQTERDFLRTEVLKTGLGLGLATLGGMIALALGAPLPWLIGSMIAVSVWVLGGGEAPIPDWLRSTAFVAIGISMGGGVTPETLQGLVAWPLSVVALCLAIPAIIVVATIYMTRIGWDRRSAILAAAPGALSMVIAIAVDTRADVRRISIVQSVRLVVLIAMVPSLIAMFGEAPIEATFGMATPPRLDDPAYWTELAILVGSGLAGGFVLHRLGLPGGFLFGAMIVSAVLHGSGMITVNLPPSVLVPGMVVLGTIIGGRFAGASFRDLWQTSATALVTLALTLTVALVFALGVSRLLGLPFGQVLLAFAPGGLEAMTIMAFALDLDPAYVGAHHLIRFLGLGLLLPLFMGPRREN